MFKVSELALRKIYTVSIKSCCFYEISLCSVQCQGRVRALLFFLEKSIKTFLQFDLKKNFVKHIENLQKQFFEKFIGDNSSITDIALRNRNLSVSPRAFFKLSIIGITLVQKGLSCPILRVSSYMFMGW